MLKTLSNAVGSQARGNAGIRPGLRQKKYHPMRDDGFESGLMITSSVGRLLTVPCPKGVVKASLSLCLVVPFIGLLTTTAHSTPSQRVQSTVDQVTIYQGLASVTRSLPIPNPGEQVVTFSCLSPDLDKDSVHVQAQDTVNIGEVSIETLSGEAATQCQYQGDATVQAQQQRVASLKAKLDAAHLTKRYLENMANVSEIRVEGDLSTRVGDIQREAARLNQDIIDLEARHAGAQDALNQLTTSSSPTDNDRVTQVRVRVASPRSSSLQPNTLKLSYQVRGAGWQPTYQAYLDTQSQTLTITASALIAQRTGEHWHDVPLTLSTVNPNRRATGRLPNRQTLGLYDPTLDDAKPMPSMAASPTAISADARYRTAKAGAAADPLPSFVVNREDKDGIIEYTLPQRVSIPSDGRRVRTVIDEQSGKSSLWIRSTPSVEAAGYWYASAPFLTPQWVEGSLQLYRDDNYIGQSRYRYQTLKEQGIGFGIDPNLLVKTLIDEDNKGKAGVLTRKQTLTRTQRYEFTNTHDREVRLQVLASEPMSRNDAVAVTVTHEPPVTERAWNDTPGIVAWEFALPSQQSQVTQSTAQVSYPADQVLTGYR